MKNRYDRQNRQRDQEDKDGYILEDFCGPIELWKTPANNYCLYMYVGSHERLYFNVHRKPEEIGELFRCACEVVSHLPMEHHLNRYLSPYQPPS